MVFVIFSHITTTSFYSLLGMHVINKHKFDHNCKVDENRYNSDDIEPPFSSLILILCNLVPV